MLNSRGALLRESTWNGDGRTEHELRLYCHHKTAVLHQRRKPGANNAHPHDGGDASSGTIRTATAHTSSSGHATARQHCRQLPAISVLNARPLLRSSATQRRQHHLGMANQRNRSQLTWTP